jgi:DNA polymerase epsilon subunit 2
MGDRSNYLKLTSTRNLLGRAGQLFLLFGMLSRDPKGRLCLEDGEGRVVLDMEDAVGLRSASTDLIAGLI